MNKVFKILRWFLGIIFIFASLGAFSDGILPLIGCLTIGLIILPASSKKLTKILREIEVVKKGKSPERLVKLTKWAILIIAFILIGAFTPKNKTTSEGKQASQEPAIKTVAKEINSHITNTPIPSVTSKPTNTPGPTSTPKPTQTPSPTNTPIPTETPIPTDANGFPMDYKEITVVDLAKVPSAYKGKTIMFTCDISSFAKNDQGDAAAFNCHDPNDFSSIVQVGGSGFFDFTKINSSDEVRVYGIGEGSSTGKNAFGGDVTEAVVSGIFLNDLTSGYTNAKE
jgi:hypothetical protein